MHLIQSLNKDGLLPNIPKWLPDNIAYLATCGSTAYGVTNAKSDTDIVGIYMPPRNMLFPWEEGYIPGFGVQPKEPEVYQLHHIYRDGVEYDINLFPIVKFFELARHGNPNIIDILFIPQHLINYCNSSARMILDNRRLFFSKAMWSRFSGFANNHMNSMKQARKTGNRSGLVAQFGYDTKDAGHVIRCMLALKQIFSSGNYCLDKYADIINGIRAGKLSYEEVMKFYTVLYDEVQELKDICMLPDKCDELAIKDVLIRCMELHYGNLKNVIRTPTHSEQALREIQHILNKYQGAY